MRKVYLAGPEVFLPNGREIIEAKRALCRAHGLEPASPVDLGGRTFSSKFERGLYVSKANEEIMRGADAVVANLTPFRGISADVGTVYEVGFMCALGRPCFGYSNTTLRYLERVKSGFYCGATTIRADGGHIGSDGHRIEDHDMIDNLMIDGGIVASGGKFFTVDADPGETFADYRAFDACLGALAVMP